MSNNTLQSMITEGVYALFKTIVTDPEYAEYYETLLQNSSVRISGCGSVSLYVDSGCLKTRDGAPIEKLDTHGLFAVLRTPVLDITVSYGRLYEIEYHTGSTPDKLPEEISLERVLSEVERVIFTDKSFDISLATITTRHLSASAADGQE